MLEVPLGVTYARNERRDLETQGRARRGHGRVALRGRARGEGRDVDRGPARDRAPLPARHRRPRRGRRRAWEARSSTRARSQATRASRAARRSPPRSAAGSPPAFGTRTRSASTCSTSRCRSPRPAKILGAARITYPTSAVDRRVRRYWLTLRGDRRDRARRRRAARPLARARRGAAAAASSRRRRPRSAPGTSTSRAPEEGPPEVRRLAHELNETAAKLQQLLESQQAFVADASHELRTPLTALRLGSRTWIRSRRGRRSRRSSGSAGWSRALLALARADAAAVRVGAGRRRHGARRPPRALGRRRAAGRARVARAQLARPARPDRRQPRRQRACSLRRGRRGRDAGGRLGRAPRRRPRPRAHRGGAQARVRPVLARAGGRARVPGSGSRSCGGWRTWTAARPSCVMRRAAASTRSSGSGPVLGTSDAPGGVCCHGPGTRLLPYSSDGRFN